MTEQEYREWLAAAVEKLGRAAEANRKRPPAFTLDELRALRQFVRKHYNEH